MWNLEFLQLCSIKNIISSEEWFEVILLQEVWTSSNNKGSLSIGILVLLSVKLAVFKTLRKGKHTWINIQCNIILVQRTQNHLPLSLTFLMATYIWEKDLSIINISFQDLLWNGLSILTYSLSKGNLSQ